jgi:hypothetical protein
MSDVNDNIAVFDEMKGQLEAEHMGKWVLIHDLALVGVYEDFEAAAVDAVSRFGRGPYLIRQVGAPPITLPASVVYFPMTHA